MTGRIGRIERYIYNQSITDRRRNNRLRKKLDVVSFSDITADRKNISKENMIDFYIKSLDTLFNYKMEDDMKSMISNVIYKFYQKMDVDKSELQMIEQYLRNTRAKKYAIPNWKAISTFFMSNGMFHLALIAREKYKERMLSTKGRVYSWERIRVYLENGNLELAQKGIEKIENSVGMRSAYQIGIATAKRFIQILTEPKQAIKDNRDTKAAENKKYYDLLNGKKIVIEGPAAEIEKPDFNDSMLYVRINDLIDRNERKTDITYLNYQSFKLYMGRNREYDNKWKYICFKVVDEGFQLTDHMRLTGNPAGIYLMGHPHMLPLVLYDLAGEDIYVTGNNLLISPVCHNKEYVNATGIEKVEESNIELCNALANHDAISQYLFLKKLYDVKLFEADRQLTYVMSLGVEKYCEIMDEVHGVGREYMIE